MASPLRFGRTRLAEPLNASALASAFACTRPHP